LPKKGIFLYNCGMSIRRTKHAVYDIKYHLVWIPKYRKHILAGEVAQYTKEVLQRIADEYELWVDTMEVVEDHVHVFLEASPSYSPAEVVQIMKSISAREVFRKFPRLRKQLWAGELWSDGYFVRSVGDRVTADVIRRYIKYQTHGQTSPQLPMFE
jgi:putative transposase